MAAAVATREAETDVLETKATGYSPKSVYNVQFPQEAILVEDNLTEPDLAKYAKFNAGVYLCTSPKVEAALRTVGYLYWEDLKPGEVARVCPHCRWRARNTAAVFAHTATHDVDK